MDTFTKNILWSQFGASIDALERAIEMCPDKVWGDPSKQPESWYEFWYLVYHTLFWLDFYLSGSTEEGFKPPTPFTLGEFDPAGVLPERVYSKEELHTYLAHGRKKCQAVIEALTDEGAREPQLGRAGFSTLELLLYNMRHVQHHVAQLNMILRQTTDSAPRWVSRAKP